VLQAAQQQHDEEHGHHLQRVLVPPLHSKQHKNQQGFRCHPSSPSLTINQPLTSHEQLITRNRGWDGRILAHLHAVEELGVLVLRLDGVHGGVEHLVPREESPRKPSNIR
jgi:hypothetical protein